MEFREFTGRKKSRIRLTSAALAEFRLPAQSPGINVLRFLMSVG